MIMNQSPVDVHSDPPAWTSEDEKEGKVMMNDEVFVTSDAVERVERNDDVDDDDESSESEDENAHLKQLRPGQNSSIRRNDSYTSFLSRSERNSILGKDLPPTQQEVAKRRIQFRDSLFDIVEFEKVEKNMKDQYWMTDTDFDRIETDVRMTQFRYENAKTGKIPFDEVNNSIRGLESVIHGVDVKLYHHRQSVLNEIHQQKRVHGCVTDWDRVRLASEKHSISCLTKAVEVGRQDELEHNKAWDMTVTTTENPAKNVTKQVEPKTRKNNPFLFWKKK
jgi:hypothetical protein